MKLSCCELPKFECFSCERLKWPSCGLDRLGKCTSLKSLKWPECKLPKFDFSKVKCPACCKLQLEVLIIGWVKSLFFLLCMITSLYYLIRSLLTQNACELLSNIDDLKEHCDKVLELTYVGIPSSFILALPQMLLIYAVKHNNITLLKVWLYIQGVTILFDLGGIVVGYFYSEIALYSAITSSIAYIYSFLRVFKLHKQLDEGAAVTDLELPEVEANAEET